MSKIITKTDEITERTLSVNHSVANGESILIGVRETDGTLRILLEIKAGTNYSVNLTGIITDTKVTL